MQDTQTLRHRSRRRVRGTLFPLAALWVAVSLPGATAFPGLAGLIAYQGSVKGGAVQIFAIRDDGSGVRRLTRTRTACEVQPTWSPDGTRIAFERQRRCGSQASSDIWVMNADGSGVRPLMQAGGFDGNPTWSPDGRKIAFESRRAGGDGDIFVAGAGDHSPAKNVTASSPANDADPSWSPGGRKIAFVTDRDGNAEIYLMNPDGKTPFRLTNSDGADLAPAWAPNGEFVVFASDRERQFDIFITNDRFLLRRLTTSAARDEMPTWSPDGKRIVYVSDSDLWVMNADGSGAHPLRQTAALEHAPDWQAAPRR